MLFVQSFSKAGPILIGRKTGGWAQLILEYPREPAGWLPDGLYRSNIEISGDTHWVVVGDVRFFISESVDTTMGFNLFVWIPMAFLGSDFEIKVSPIETNSTRDSGNFLRTPPNYQDI